MCSRKPNGKPSFYDDDRSYAIAIYSFYILCTTAMVIFDNKYYTMVQGRLNIIFQTLTWFLVVNMAVCLFFCIRRKCTMELFCLIMGIAAISLLIIEKTLAFHLYSQALSIGVYIDYISIHVFKLAFIIYRFLKVNKIILSNETYSKLLKEGRGMQDE